VHSSRPLLASRLIGADRVSDRVADSHSLSIVRCCRRWIARFDMGHRYIARARTAQGGPRVTTPLLCFVL
jgi:hypothetical protein